jgi:hypothetical protein
MESVNMKSVQQKRRDCPGPFQDAIAHKILVENARMCDIHDKYGLSYTDIWRIIYGFKAAPLWKTVEGQPTNE